MRYSPGRCLRANTQDRNRDVAVIHRYIILVIALPIRLYQLALSPLLGSNCRFHPTCSSYAIEALYEHGPFRGLLLAVKRIGRCHPFSKGGLDPVPTIHQNAKNTPSVNNN